MQLEDIKEVLSSIPSQAAVLDAAGTIIQVNESWSTFARENDGTDALASGVGVSYLEVCRSAAGPWADEAPVAYDGIRAVLNGTRATFNLEYPCHSSTEQRWFCMTVLPFNGTLGWAVVSHVNITQRKLAEIRRAGLARIVERSLNEIYIYDADSLRFIEVNEAACRNLGYTLNELRSMTPVDIKPEHSEATFAALVSPLLNDGKDKIVFTTVQRRKDGSDYPVEVHLQRMTFDDRQVFAAISLDITEREQQRLAAAVRSRTLEKMARGAPLDEILTNLVQTTEELEPAVLASVMLVDPKARVLRCGAGPSLPNFYLSAIDGLAIADNVGACGTTAFRGERVICEDLRTDPRWDNYRDLVDTAGLRACWSEPILSSKHEVLGTFAFYYTEPGRPGPEALAFSQNSAHVASIAIERAQADEALSQSEARFRDLVEGSVQGIVIERDGTALFANQSFADLFGYEDPAEIVTIESLSSLCHPDELGRMAQHRTDCSIAPQVHVHYEFRGVRKDGGAVWIETRERVVMWGDQPAIQSTVIDITERHRAEEALFYEKERVQVTLESIGDAVITTDAQGRVNYCNAVAEALTGWRRDEAVGQPLTGVFRIVNEQTREPVTDPVARCLTEDTVVGLANHTVLVNRHGHEYAIQDSAAPVRNRQGELLGAVLVFSDVSEQRRLTQEMSHHVSHDALTGLVNRHEFEHRLERVLETAHADHSEHALCYVDLDQFKVINDTCGHAAGDTLLGHIADLFRGKIRERDTLARLGGDEFGVLLEHCGLEQAKRVANALRCAVDEYRFVWDNKPLRIGVSIGVVQITENSRSISALLQAADRACYVAKDAGRNRIHVYHAHDAELARRHGEMQWVSRIQLALEDDRFQLYTQLIEHMEPNAATGLHCEVLLRLVDETGRIILPGAFIPAAERYDLAVRIDRWVINHVFRWLAEQPAVVDSLELCTINLSGHSLSDRLFEAHVLRQLEATGIPGEKIGFEITETAAIANLNDATRFIKTLKTHGCRFALDDFGSGLSSFAYLKNLPVDFLKIDGIFVKDIVDDPIDLAMVRSINEIGQLMGKQTIAEYVENEAIRNQLRELGVNLVQGFGVSRPQPIADLLKETGRYGQAEVRSRAPVE